MARKNLEANRKKAKKVVHVARQLVRKHGYIHPESACTATEIKLVSVAHTAKKRLKILEMEKKMQESQL